MTRTRYQTVLSRVISCVFLALTLPASADTFFDNSQVDLKYRLNPGLAEGGDQIRLERPGFLTHFAFEFYGTNSLSADNTQFSGSIEARVRFYLNDGPLFNGVQSP